VKTALVVNGSRFNGRGLSISLGPDTFGPGIVEDTSIFSSLIRSVNNTVDDIDNRFQISEKVEETGKNIKEKFVEIDNKLGITKKIEETGKNIKESVEGIDNKLQIRQKIQEFPGQVSEVLTKTKENLDEGLTWGMSTLKIIGEKVSVTTSDIGEKISVTTSVLGESVSQVIQNLNTR